LRNSNNLAEWAQALADRVQEYTADDASLVIAALGFRGYPAIRHCYKDRFERLAREYIHPFIRARESGATEIAALKTEQWSRYRAEYEKWIRCMDGDR
jgi:hypothetical protein